MRYFTTRYSNPPIKVKQESKKRVMVAKIKGAIFKGNSGLICVKEGEDEIQV